MKKYRVTNVEWDADDVSDLANLPKVLIVEAESEDELGDIIADTVGFCHNGFEYDEVPT